jgi:hypothetical protein
VDSLPEAKGWVSVCNGGGTVIMVVLLQQSMRIGAPILGLIIPLVIFIGSFVVTWLLYRHFSKQSQ